MDGTGPTAITAVVPGDELGGMADELPQRFGVNVFSSYGVAAAQVLSALLLTPLLLRSLGDAAFGVWALAGSVIVYLEVLELGFGATTTKFVAEDAGRRPDGVIRTLNTNFFILCVLGAVGLVVGLVIAAFAPGWFSVPDPLAGETTIVFAVLAVSLATSIPADTIGGGLAGHRRYDLLGASNVALILATVAVSAGVVGLGGGLVALAVGTATVSVAAHVLRWFLLKRLVPDLRLSPRLIDRSRLRPTARLSAWYLVGDLAVTVITRIDLTVIGVVLGVREVALFAVGSKLAVLSHRVLLPLTQVFFPEASALASGGDHQRLRTLLVNGTRLALFTGVPITLVLSLLGGPLVRAWVGDAQRGAVGVLVVMAAAYGLRAVTSTATQMLAGAGLAKVTGKVALTEAVVNLVASLLLIHWLGVVGVAVGTLVGVVVVDLPVTVVLACRLTRMRPAELLTSAVLPHLGPGLAAAAVLVATRGTLADTGPGLVVAAVLGGATYLVGYACFGASGWERERIRTVLGRASTLVRGR